MNYTDSVLEIVSSRRKTNSLELAELLKCDHQRIVGILNSIQANGSDILAVESKSKKVYDLTEEGQFVISNGSYEFNIFNKIPDEGVEQKKLCVDPKDKIGFSKAMSNGWIRIDKETGLAKRQVSSVSDMLRNKLENVNNLIAADISDLKKRKMIVETTTKYFEVEKGTRFTKNLEKFETDLTMDMLQNDQWSKLKFKDYNFDAKGTEPECGAYHPLMKVRSEFRQIFLEMGFSEMATNNYVENSFWNFDALFVPQKHPAREAHDTFYVSNPKESSIANRDYLEQVRKVHSCGCYGSKGYGYDWKIEEAQKNLLRTHTTAVSARMLQAIGAQKTFKPTKLFSIDRVFRNETLDATHLAEFHQVEGIVADKNLNLGNLIALLKEFFAKLGMTQLKFKPAYNPYTEPSMEVFCYHPGLRKWIEIGNSGMFRPEMLRPMGLPPQVTVLAWGVSLERPAMIKYGFNNIRDLVGPKVDFNMIKNNPICMLNK